MNTGRWCPHETPRRPNHIQERRARGQDHGTGSKTVCESDAKGNKHRETKTGQMWGRAHSQSRHTLQRRVCGSFRRFGRCGRHRSPTETLPRWAGGPNPTDTCHRRTSCQRPTGKGLDLGWSDVSGKAHRNASCQSRTTPASHNAHNEGPFNNATKRGPPHTNPGPYAPQQSSSSDT
jgi:hypothetical protein